MNYIPFHLIPPNILINNSIMRKESLIKAQKKYRQSANYKNYKKKYYDSNKDFIKNKSKQLYWTKKILEICDNDKYLPINNDLAIYIYNLCDKDKKKIHAILNNMKKLF